MAKKQLVASKDFSYMTRRLKVGDAFECSARDAKVLVGIKLAAEPREIGEIAPPPAALAEQLAKFDHDGDGNIGGSKVPEGDLTALRQIYFTKMGKRAFNGWDAAELTRRMVAAGQ